MRSITVTDVSLSSVREPLAAPFGFKGAYIDSLTQAISTVGDGDAAFTVPSTQSVLWSDSGVFTQLGPEKGDSAMLALTKRALESLKGATFTSPLDVTPALAASLTDYAESVCGRRVRPTFILNSLVGIDIALWSLYAYENGIQTFAGMMPPCAAVMNADSSRLAQIPLISYGVDAAGIRRALDSGCALLKIKIGAPGSNVSHEEDMRAMLAKDEQRLLDVHNIAKNYSTDLTKSGRVCYYLDANGRYDSVARLTALLDFADSHGFMDRISMLEEPFAEEDDSDVSSLPVVINADESAHSVADVRRRISQGYRAIALKPIAKTVSVSFEMAAEAIRSGCACFCADLTVNPLLACWNMQFASKLPPLPVMNCGCVEINGDTNYKNWDSLVSALPEGIKYKSALRGAFDCGGNAENFKKMTGR